MKRQSSFDPAGILARLRHEEVEGLFDFLEHTQFWIKDSGGRYLKVNRAFLLNYSLPRTSLVIGKTDHDLSPAYLAEQFARDDMRVLKGERILGRIELVGGFDRVAGWFRTSKIPVRDRDGMIAGTAGITRRLPRLQAPEFPVPELAPGLAAMQKEPSRRWSNAELAKLAGLSVSAFERKFRRHLHTTPMRFLKRLRLTRAAAALVQSDRTLAEIAIREGFSDQAHFSREFRRGFGLAPRAWRERERCSRDHDTTGNQ